MYTVVQFIICKSKKMQKYYTNVLAEQCLMKNNCWASPLYIGINSTARKFQFLTIVGKSVNHLWVP